MLLLLFLSIVVQNESLEQNDAEHIPPFLPKNSS